MAVRLIASIVAGFLLCCGLAMSITPARAGDTILAGSSGSTAGSSTTPSGAFPSLDVPASAHPGSTIPISGSGWSPDKPVSVWIGPAGTISEVQPVGLAVNRDGTVAGQVIAPTEPGDYAVLACQNCKGFQDAVRRCAALDLVHLACRKVIVVRGTSSAGSSSTHVKSATTGGRTGPPGSVGDTGASSGTSPPWPLAVAAGAVVLLAAAIVTWLLLRRRRLLRPAEPEARLRALTPGGISVQDGDLRLEVRVSTSVPLPETSTEDRPR